MKFIWVILDLILKKHWKKFGKYSRLMWRFIRFVFILLSLFFNKHSDTSCLKEIDTNYENTQKECVILWYFGFCYAFSNTISTFVMLMIITWFRIPNRTWLKSHSYAFLIWHNPTHEIPLPNQPCVPILAWRILPFIFV